MHTFSLLFHRRRHRLRWIPLHIFCLPNRIYHVCVCVCVCHRLPNCTSNPECNWINDSMKTYLSSTYYHHVQHIQYNRLAFTPDIEPFFSLRLEAVAVLLSVDAPPHTYTHFMHCRFCLSNTFWCCCYTLYTGQLFECFGKRLLSVL